MANVDYAYYTDTFKGTVIPSSDVFDSFAVKAEQYINKITFGRITEYTDGIKNAVCAVCEIMLQFEGRSGISSESNDGYSVTYNNDTGKTYKEFLYMTAKMWLPGELLYRGVE